MTAQKLNENTEVQVPLKNLIGMVVGASVATWAYFGVIERINQLEHTMEMAKNDVHLNTEFRIRWPRGELGSLPADSEQYMLLEHLQGELDKLTKTIESGQAPFDQQQKLTIEFFERRLTALEKVMQERKLNGN
jgi:hypothetical protein